MKDIILRLFKTHSNLFKDKNRRIWALQIGVYLLRYGTIFQVGQPFDVPRKNGKKQRRWIKNLYFNYRQNKVTYSFSDKPIKGFSQHFTHEKRR